MYLIQYKENTYWKYSVSVTPAFNNIADSELE